MFEGLLPNNINIFATTASTASQVQRTLCNRRSVCRKANMATAFHF
jgi:hypothetical protein